MSTTHCKHISYSELNCWKIYHTDNTETHRVTITFVIFFFLNFNGLEIFQVHLRSDKNLH